MVKMKKHFFLLKKRKLYERLDFYPFLILKLVFLLFLYLYKIKYILYYIYIFGSVYFIQLSLLLINYAFVNFEAITGYFPTNNIDNATHVKVSIFANNIHFNNKVMICKIIRECNIIKIEVDKLIYIYDKTKRIFNHSKYEILKETKLSKYLEIKPIQNSELAEKKAKFGPNNIDIPSKSFINLYEEHIMSPFFIFLFICSLIRVFDNSSYKFLIALIMIFIFEISITWKGIYNSTTIKNMKTPPHYIYVYRNDEWSLVSSVDIYPGDIISLTDGYSYKNIKEKDKNMKKGLIFKISNLLNNIKIKQQEIKNQKSLNTVLDKYKEKEVLPITCDVIILNGKAIVNESMLNGESLPQIKDSITNINKIYQNSDETLDIKNLHKNIVIFGGTKIEQIEPNNKVMPVHIKKCPPNNGIICLVLKTGFSSYQGKKLHNLLFNKVKNPLYFKRNQMILISFLFLIALLSSIHILFEAKKREELSNFVFLKILIILTSIVPLDLPVQLSLIMHKCIYYFESKSIICIEPSKIPYAGNIDICCFDLIGTLTTNEFNILGVINANDNDDLISSCAECDENVISILLGCNNLNNAEGKIFGEPIDISIMKEMKGKITNNEISCNNRKIKIIPIKKYIFESELKRITVLAKVYNDYEKDDYSIRVMCKGAPEVIKNILKEVPENYDECYLKWAKKGYHIIALAYNDNEKYNINTERNILEKGLIFAGFCIYEIPIKDKVEKYMNELIKSKYDICIITGESLLTSIKIINQINLGYSNKFLSLKIEDKKLLWKVIDSNQIIKESKSIEDIKLLSEEYFLCITSEEYKKLNTITLNIKNIYVILEYIKLFCRMSENNKLEIISNLKLCGRNPLMCGDGTNDLGALKISNVGVTLLNIKESIADKRDFLYFEENTIIKNWDTTAVTPFISKGESIKCIKNIILMGKYYLILNIQMHKIFIINTISNIYIKSILALKGIQFSEHQYLFLSFIISIFFLNFCKVKTLNKLNPNKIKEGIFSMTNIISIVGQIFINIASMNLLLYFTGKIDPFLKGQENSLNEQFRPNLNNSIIYVYQILNQVIIFVANYQGEPFMENLNNNSSIIKIILGIILIGYLYIFDLFKQVNYDFGLVALPEDNYFRFFIIFILLFNFAFCYVLEKWKNIFDLYEPYEINKDKKKKN